MKIDSFNIDKAVENVRGLLLEDGVSPSLRAAIELLITVVMLLVNRLNLNSRNSSKPPSTDRFKPERKPRPKSGKKSGGQKGHAGAQLKPVPDPDEIISLSIDRRTIPSVHFSEEEPIKRQVIEILIQRHVSEYQAQVLVDDKGVRYVAEFPAGITQTVQYGASVKAQVVYKSQSQLIPGDRVAEDLADNANIPLSSGSVHNFINEAFDLLAPFEEVAKSELIVANIAHADETGINVGGKNHWLHSVSNFEWTFFFAHEKRGSEAMEAMGILPLFSGILCHDHWKPYFGYDFSHALCNAHHLRELERAIEQEACRWADKMKAFLLKVNKHKEEHNDTVSVHFRKKFRTEFREIIARGEIETPPPPIPKEKKRGRLKKSKTRNLLERLRDYEVETLRFMNEDGVPFTNNQGERDIRMTKVQQKISGCFRSIDGARRFARIRSFISTCNKRGISSAYALNDLFNGVLPTFVTNVKPANVAE